MRIVLPLQRTSPEGIDRIPALQLTVQQSQRSMDCTMQPPSRHQLHYRPCPAGTGYTLLLCAQTCPVGSLGTLRRQTQTTGPRGKRSTLCRSSQVLGQRLKMCCCDKPRSSPNLLPRMSPRGRARIPRCLGRRNKARASPADTPHTFCAPLSRCRACQGGNPGRPCFRGQRMRLQGKGCRQLLPPHQSHC